MKKHIKKLWVDALRSGKYKQGFKELKTQEGSFCCLGVLCDLHRKTCRNKKYKWSYTNRRLYLGEQLVLPTAVQKWAGLNEKVPKVNGEYLAILNDIRDFTFKQIAHQINKYL